MNSIRPAVRIQHVVPKKLPGIPVEAVGSRLDGGVYDPALEIAEFSWCVAGYEIELLDGVRGWRVTQQVIRYLVVIHAVQQEIVGLLTVAIDQRASRTKVCCVVAGSEAFRIRCYRSGCK